MMDFLGYPRRCGPPGVRDHVLVLSTVVCANHVVEEIGRSVRDAVVVTHEHGCTMLGADLDRLRRVLLGFATHPNVGAVLVVGLGCEQVQAEEIVEAASKLGRLAVRSLIQERGGEASALNAGRAAAEGLLRSLQTHSRVRMPISELIVATECGASDYTSGISSNPVIGYVVDRVTEMGGMAFLSETTELIGAEHILARRCASPGIAERLLAVLGETERRAIQAGVDIRGAQPTPGNIRGGVTTIEEKSLGCIQKAGKGRIEGVAGYAEPATGNGLWVMDTPGHDVQSVTGMVAGGAQIVLFSTGMGTPVGCAIAPVVKITGNPGTAIRMAEHIDLDVGAITDGSMTIEAGGTELLRILLDCASGSLAKAERLGHMEFGFCRTEPSL